MIKIIIYYFILVFAVCYDLLIRFLEWISDFFGKVYVVVTHTENKNTV